MRRCAAFSLLLPAACLFPSVSDLGGGDGGDAAVETAAPDAGHAPIASVGSVATETGNAQQTHVIWAAGAKRWWLFTIDDDTTHIKTRSSADFVTWTDGESLALAHTNGGEGRNFSVAYAFVGGADVVHLSVSHAEPSTLTHSHTRALVSGSTIAFGAPLDIGTPVAAAADGVDGNVTMIGPDGSVWDSFGFTVSQGTNSGMGHYNEDVYAASSAETGAPTWSATFAQTTIEVVNQQSNAHALAWDTAPLAVWEDGAQEPDPNNLHYASFQNSWSSPANVFPTDSAEDPNDWDVAVLRAGATVETHVVRGLSSGSYDHVYGASGPMEGGAPPPSARAPGTGVVLLADPAHLAAFAIAADGSIQRSRWDGSQFGAWETIAPARTRAYLSGYCPDLGAHPEAGGCALVWTEPGAGGYEVDGMLVSIAP